MWNCRWSALEGLNARMHARPPELQSQTPLFFPWRPVHCWYVLLPGKIFNWIDSPDVNFDIATQKQRSSMFALVRLPLNPDHCKRNIEWNWCKQTHLLILALLLTPSTKPERGQVRWQNLSWLVFCNDSFISLSCLALRTVYVFTTHFHIRFSG